MKKREKIAREIYAKIDNNLKYKNLTRSYLARELAIPDQTLSDIMKNLKNGRLVIKIHQLLDIQEKLNIKIINFF